jgi:argininosuccinate lyase
MDRRETKLWGGRFAEPTDALVERLNASVDVDKRLFRHDILGSLAHAHMLCERGLLELADYSAIHDGLVALLGEIEGGGFAWRTDREDVHMNIEAALAERIGDAAGRLHTARSRNDQVALDVRMWLREELLQTAEVAVDLLDALRGLAERGEGVLMPGYTHLQRAQPVVAAHHVLAWFEMIDRDVSRLLDGYARVNVMPLGSGALAATPLPIDRERTAELLRFPAITRNSMDAVSDRDFAVEFLAHAALCQIHLSRMSEDLVLWMSQEFGFITLPDAFCTGSSIMPQKKNPDIPELVRGKAGRVMGDLVALLTVLKGLPLTYNKDMQEDKEPLFDAAETLSACLTVMARMLSRAEFRPDRMRRALDEGYLLATDVADALVENGIPFRRAHHIVGRLVALAAERGVDLAGLSREDLERETGLGADLLLPSLDPYRSIQRRDVPGGPAPNRVRAALEDASARVLGRREDLARRRAAIDLSHLLKRGG